MKKISSVSFVFAFIILQLSAQNIFHEWSFNPKDTAIYGGEVRIQATVTDDSGNSYSTGYFNGAANLNPLSSQIDLFTNGYSDAFVVKYDESGNYIWSFNVGGGNGDYPTSITVENNEFVYIVGTFYGTADFDPSENEFLLNAIQGGDIFIAKYDTAGNFIWAKALNGSSSVYVQDIEVDNNGVLYITGGFYGNLDFDPSANTAIFESTGQSIYIAKYDSDGNYLWAKTLDGSSSNSTGFDLSLDSDDNIILTGRFSGTVDFDPFASNYNLTANAGSIHFFVAKYTNDGNFVWAFNGGSTSNTEGTSVAVDANNNIFVTGVFFGSVDFDPSANSSFLTATNYDIFLAKYNSSGEYQWAKKIGGSAWYSRGYKVIVDSLQNVVLTGYFEGGLNFDPSNSNFMLYAFNSDGFLAKYTNNGAFEWAFQFGSNEADFGVSIANGRNGSIRLAGNFKNTIYVDSPTNSTTISSGQDALNSFLGSYNSSGTYLWANRIGGFTNRDYQQQARDIISDSENNVYVTGSYSGDLDFNPSESNSNYLLSSYNQTNIFLGKYSENGAYIWAISLNGENYNQGRKLAVDHNDDIILGGIFSNDVDFNPSETEDSIIQPSAYFNNNIFLAKYTMNGDFVWAFKLESNANTYSYITGLKTDANGNIYISGHSYGAIDLDPSSGTTQFTPQGDNVSFIAKYSNSGSLIWAKEINSNSNVTIEDLSLDSENNSYITGYFKGDAQFNSTNSNGNISSSNIYDEDIFIAKFNATAILFG